MKKLIIIAVTILFLAGGGIFFMTREHKTNGEVFGMKTIQFKAADGVQVTADLYLTENKKAPLILLFHQASYSRGEYFSIAPKLNAMGFNCMAVDQRSGMSVHKIENETYKSAKLLHKGTAFANAYPDMEAALLYVEKEIKPEKLIVWGSSYSASLSYILFSEHATEIDGMLTFSPGEYFKYNGKTIAEYAKTVNCPIFITSAKSEGTAWKSISEALPNRDKKNSVFFIPMEEGVHGSSALLETTKNNKEYWDAVEAFLKANFQDSLQ